MSARTATRPHAGGPTAAYASPRKASRAPAPVIHDDLPSDLLDSAHLDALRADYDLEAASYLRALAKKHGERIKAVQRCFADTLAALDDQVRSLSLQRFVGEFGADPGRAIKGLVGEQMRPVPMSQVEQSVRKRKRAQAVSPRPALDDDDADVFGTSKKARSTASLFSSAAKGIKKVPASVARSASTRSKRGGMSPTSGRKPRLRLRPSTSTTTSTAATGGSSSLVYRANPYLPPTPGPSTALGTARRPKRGESIVMRSMNGSPLGQFVASEEEEDDDSDGEGEGSTSDEEEGWDLLERNEASKIEHQSASKKKKEKRNQRAAKPGPPTAASFAVALPAGAPSFDALKARWMDEMQARLRKADVSEAERRRLEEVLVASMSDL